MQDLEIITSADGSHTIHSSLFGVSYHSLHGSVQESETVFMNAGLDYLMEKGLSSINIFEMGFGSGLNAIMAYKFCQRHGISIQYHGIEKFPIDMATVDLLNYGKVLGFSSVDNSFFKAMHEAESKKLLNNGNFTFKRTLGDVAAENLGGEYDVVFYDAFAPNSQPELWEEEAMKRMYGILNGGGVLTSYCAKGVFKRVLKSVGFMVETLPGPVGKREMTRAVKI